MVPKKSAVWMSNLPDRFTLALGQRVFEARNKREVTLRELARKMSANGHKYTYGGLSQVERGEINCTVRVLCQIAKALDVKPSVLLDPRWRQKI